MRGRWIWRGFKFALVVVVAVGAIGGAVMLLWNALLPPLFGWPVLSFWQALGLLVLTRVLTGGWRGRWGHGGPWRARMEARWAAMSDEERERFRAGMRYGCGRRSQAPMV